MRLRRVPDVRSSSRISFSVTPEEKAKLIFHARSQGMVPAALARDIFLDGLEEELETAHDEQSSSGPIQTVPLSTSSTR